MSTHIFPNLSSCIFHIFRQLHFFYVKTFCLSYIYSSSSSILFSNVYFTFHKLLDSNVAFDRWIKLYVIYLSLYFYIGRNLKQTYFLKSFGRRLIAKELVFPAETFEIWRILCESRIYVIDCTFHCISIISGMIHCLQNVTLTVNISNYIYSSLELKFNT